MTAAHPASGFEIPGERWRRVALARVRQVQLGRPWQAVAQRLIARASGTGLGTGVRRDTGDSASARAPLPRRLAVPPLPARQAPEPPRDLPRPGGEASAEQGTGPRPLDRNWQGLLEQVLAAKLPRISVRTDLVADRLTRRHRADALVQDGTIHFRRGAFAPGSAKGFGLLAHEALHLAWARGLRPAQAPTSAVNPAELEEQLALEVEKRVLRNHTLMTSGARAPAQALAARQPEGGEAAPGHARGGVKTALSGRDLSAAESPAAPAGGVSADQLRTLKDDLYRMLLDRLRSEFERGA